MNITLEDIFINEENSINTTQALKTAIENYLESHSTEELIKLVAAQV